MSSELNFDRRMMERCLELAERGISSVAPNPMVGSVVVLNDQVIGEGYHQRFGGAHAEVKALSSIAEPEALKGSTLYVNLEPCSHHGKTPPCVEAIYASGIQRVVVGCLDPFEDRAGSGVAYLRERGVEVVDGVLQKECKDLNRRFFTFVMQKRPYVILKWAETADRFIARSDYSSKWISSEASRKLVHKWRSEESAVLVGTNTAQYDNPELTVRQVEGRNPIRLVIDRNLRLSPSLKLFDRTEGTWVFSREERESVDNLSFFKISNWDRLLPDMLGLLYGQGVLSVIVEGGAHLLETFVEENLWDEARVFHSTERFGSGIAAPKFSYEFASEQRVANDRLSIAFSPFSRAC